MRMAGDRVPRPAPKPKAQPKPKPFVLKIPHDVGITARPKPVKASPKNVAARKEGIAPNPAPRKPFAKAYKRAQGVKGTAPPLSQLGPQLINLKNVEPAGKTPGVHLAVPGTKGKVVFKHGTKEEAQQAKALKLTNVKAALSKEGILGSVQSTPAALDRALPKKGALGLGGNLVKDALDIPAQTPASVFLTDKALVEHPGKTLKSLGKSTLQAFTPKGAYENPLATVLLVRGGEAALSRGAGAALRSGAVGKAAKEFASTQRVPLHLSGERVQLRQHQRGLVENRIGKARDKQAAKKQGTTPVNIKERNAQGEVVGNNYTQAIRAGQRQGARLLKIHAHHIIDLNEGVRRAERQAAIKARAKAMPKHGRDAVPLIVEGTIRTRGTVVSDLTNELRRLQHEHTGLKHPADKAANQRMQKQVKGRLGDEKFMQNPEPAFKSAEAYIKDYTPLERELVAYGHHTQEQIDRAKLVPYAVKHMGAKYDPATGELSLHGKALTNDEIVAHMPEELRNRGVGYFTQRSGMTTARAMYQAALSRPRGGRARTGEAARRGTYQANYEALVHQHAYTQGILSRIRGVNKLINTYGIKKAGRYFKNWSEAQRYANDLAAVAQKEGRPFQELVPMYVTDFTPSRLLIKEGGETINLPGRTRNFQQIASHLDPAKLEDVEQSLASKVNGAFEENMRSGEVVLVPKVVKERLIESSKPSKLAEKEIQAVTNQFRQTVLPLSPRWVLGNTLEAAVRLGVEGGLATPLDYRAGKRVLNAAENPNELHANLTSGLNFGHAKRYDIHRGPDQFGDGVARDIASTLHTIRNAKGPKQAFDGWLKLRDGVIYKTNTWLEVQSQYAAIGRTTRRELQTFTQSWLKTLIPATDLIDHAARGLMNPDAIVKYGREVDRILGQYSHLSPEARHRISTYAPFGMWFKNALHFVGTAPLHHPVATGIGTAAYLNTQKQREAAGLGEFLPANIRVPGFLQGAIPTKDGKIRINQLTPFGAFSDVGETISGEVLPQAGFLSYLNGVDWKGKPLEDANHQPLNELQRLAAAILQSVLPSGVPGVQAYQNFQKKGVGSGLESMVNPLHVVKNTTTAKKAKGAPPPPPPVGAAPPPPPPPPPPGP